MAQSSMKKQLKNKHTPIKTKKFTVQITLPFSPQNILNIKVWFITSNLYCPFLWADYGSNFILGLFVFLLFPVIIISGDFCRIHFILFANRSYSVKINHYIRHIILTPNIFVFIIILIIITSINTTSFLLVSFLQK